MPETPIELPGPDDSGERARADAERPKGSPARAKRDVRADAPPNEQPESEPSAEYELDLAEAPLLDRVYFVQNNSQLDGVAVQLDAVAELALHSEDYDATLLIIGHADVREHLPEELSMQRAAAVRAYLLRRGVSPLRMRVTAVGDSHPSELASTQPARNQRVEIRILLP